MIKPASFLILLIFIGLSFFARPQVLFSQDDALPPDLEMSDELQHQLREVSRTLRCAVCQSESVWESNATLAIQMRDIVKERLIAGQTPDEIRAYFVSRYGDYIVFKPRFKGINLLLWGGPFILLTIGVFILFRKLRSWTSPSGETDRAIDEGLTEIDSKQRKRIEDELRSPR